MPVLVADAPTGRLEHALLPPHEAAGFNSASAPYAMGVSFTGHLGAVVRHAEDRSRALDFEPGTVGINGPCPLSWLRTSEPSESVEIIPSATALASAADEHGISWDRLDTYRQHGRDPAVWAASARARRLLRNGEASAEAVEELVTSLLAHVAAAYAGGRRARRRSLDAHRLRTATDQIHSDPWATHSLAELAHVVHLSPFHFLRSFRTDVGVTPHQYVLAVRAEHARRLLQQDRVPVSAVAAEVGVDVRQLRRVLRREVDPLRPAR